MKQATIPSMKHLKNLLLLGVFACIGATSCSSSEEIEASTSFTLILSPDILKFVTPQVSYVDEKGSVVTLTGVEELDNMVVENKVETSKGGVSGQVWTNSIQTGTGYKSWNIKMAFERLGFHSYMGVKYLPKELPDEADDKVYDFFHSVTDNISVIKVSESTHNQDVSVYTGLEVSIDTGDYKAGDNARAYIERLLNNPDKVGFIVDNDGTVTKNNDFEL